MFHANLPWYDLDEIRPATESFWRGLVRHLRALGLEGAPHRLSDVPYEELWRSPRLLFSQCCGYDAILPWRRTLRVVATPCYAAPGCVGPTYSSFVVVRDDSPYRALAELRGARAVINNRTSHSGMSALRAIVAPLHRGGRFFSDVAESGCHVRSIEMIADGEADVAAIDSVVVELLRRHAPQRLAGLRPIAQTQAVPAPPFVTSAAMPPVIVRLLRRALDAAMRDPALEAEREAMLLRGVEVLPLEAYRPIVEQEQVAARLGYQDMQETLRQTG